MKVALAGHDVGEFQPPPLTPPSAISQRLDTADTAAAADEAH
jgi:hypothetical protein